jgi:hypothetical protein
VSTEGRLSEISDPYFDLGCAAGNAGRVEAWGGPVRRDRFGTIPSKAKLPGMSGRRERRGWVYPYSNPCIAWTGRLWVGNQPQSSSASRFTAGAGFLNLSESGERRTCVNYLNKRR